MSTLKTSNLQHASAASANITLASDGTTTIAAPSNIIKSGTAVASTSGTSIDFTSIPSWVKRVTVMLDGVSINGTSPPQLQIGDSGGIETSGYLSTNFNLLHNVSPAGAAFTAGFGIGVSTGQWSATVVVQGLITVSLLNASTNTWVATGTFARSDVTTLYVTSGSKSLSATLDRVRVTTANGTDAFDAGTINILYEG